MKRLFSIRSYLTLINIIVTTLILLLVTGFLALGWQNAQEGQNLTISGKIESLATTFFNAATAEKRLAYSLTHNTSPPGQIELQRLTDLGRISETTANQLALELGKLIKTNRYYFTGTRSSKKDAGTTLSALNDLNEYLKIYRSYTLAELNKVVNDRDPAVSLLLPDSLSRSVEIAAKIADKLTFLPSKDAVSVDRYKDLKAGYWKLFRNISAYDELLTALNFSALEPTASTLDQFSAYESLINSGWDDLGLFNLANDVESPLPALVEQARLTYYGSHYKLITQMKAGTQYGFQQYTSPAAWEGSIEDVRARQQAIVNFVHERTNAIGVRLHQNAARSISILIIILVVSLVASFLLFWLGQRIKKQADTDNLTGLANRATFETVLHTYEQEDTKQIRQAVYFIDINKFKQINDNYGHRIGEQILVEVAKRIERVSAGHLTARVGEDDFAVYMRDLEQGFDADVLGKKFLDSINGDFDLNGTTIRIEAGIGYAISPDDSHAGTALLKNADIAHYRRKSGQNSCGSQILSRYNSNIGDLHVKRRRLEAALLTAIENQEFTLHYQPKVCTTTCTVRSVEALIRWKRPDATLISPAEFIPVAEELGLMEKIGTFVMEKACQDIASLHHKGFTGLGVAVNISSQQFMDEQFCEKVLRSAKDANLGAGFLELEVTESIVMNDIDRVTGLLNRLRATGIKIAIDDFGTGYSCLSYLQDLPLDTLKIDRAFVEKLGRNMSHQTVANSIVQLAVLFGLSTVAEGVENDAQRHEVAMLGIDLIQGYYYSKPVPLEDLAEVIRQVERRQHTSLVASAAQAKQITDRDDFDQDSSINKAA